MFNIYKQKIYIHFVNKVVINILTVLVWIIYKRLYDLDHSRGFCGPPLFLLYFI